MFVRKIVTGMSIRIWEVLNYKYEISCVLWVVAYIGSHTESRKCSAQ
jgi:hypothetical protein